MWEIRPALLKLLQSPGSSSPKWIGVEDIAVTKHIVKLEQYSVVGRHIFYQPAPHDMSQALLLVERTNSQAYSTTGADPVPVSTALFRVQGPFHDTGAIRDTRDLSGDFPGPYGLRRAFSGAFITGDTEFSYTKTSWTIRF